MNDVEQEFYKAFGIEPYISCNTGFIAHYKGRSYVCDAKTCKKCKSNKKVYPEITDRRLLNMICINSYFCGVNFHNLWVKNPDELKAIVLDEIIRWYKEQKHGHKECKHQIQQLFKEEE